MTQGERVRAVRKALNLTLDKFGKSLGVGKTAISLIENGKNNLTDANIKAICREFNVDYIWLTTGEGEMFFDSDDTIFEAIDRIMVGEDEFHKDLFKTFVNLTSDEVRALKQIMDKFMAIRNEKKD